MWAHRTGWLGALCALLLTAAACSDDGDTSNTPVLDVGDEGPGTCLLVDDALGAQVTKLPVIDCATPHSHEIYAVVDYDEGDVFPGLEALDAFAESSCFGQFADYVGVQPIDSTLRFSWLVPTLDSWNDHDDREVLCVLFDAQATPLTGTMQGTRR